MIFLKVFVNSNMSKICHKLFMKIVRTLLSIKMFHFHHKFLCRHLKLQTYIVYTLIGILFPLQILQAALLRII